MDLFFNDLGMVINSHKSSFLDNGMDEATKDVIYDFIPFKVVPFKDICRYWVCFIKPNHCLKGDWSWMLRKFEYKLTNWTSRWLSLRGRLTLVKYVLENILVYWLSLEKVLQSILENIR